MNPARRARRFAPALLGILALAPARAARAQRVAEIQVAPGFLRLVPGAQTAMLATAYDRDGNPVNARIVWASTNINVAAIDTNGMVHAIAPGLTIVTATVTDSSPGSVRRHWGRATVMVGGTMDSRTYVYTMPGGKTLADPGDTVPPAACSEPETGMRNPGRSCWDMPPMRRGTLTLEPPAGCGDMVTPAVFMVRVNADGSIAETRALTSSSCDAYQSVAQDSARHWAFMPAHRNGRTVAAWTIIAVRPPRMRVFPMMPPAAMPPGATPAPASPATPRPPAPEKVPPRP